MRRMTAIMALMIALVPAGLSHAYPWDQDMVDQPSEKPQESEAVPGPGSVPTDGGEVVPIPADDAEADEMKLAAAALRNPVPATAESIARGEVFFQTNCLVCHGATGQGDGPVGQKFATKAPVDLNDAYTQDQTDGELYFTLTRGRALMPAYRDALRPDERWDLINYLRSEFGQE